MYHFRTTWCEAFSQARKFSRPQLKTLPTRPTQPPRHSIESNENVFAKISEIDLILQHLSTENLYRTIQNRQAAAGGPKNWVLPVKRQKSSHSQKFGVRSPPWGGGVSSEFLYLSIVLEKCVYLSPMGGVGVFS